MPATRLLFCALLLLLTLPVLGAETAPATDVPGVDATTPAVTAPSDCAQDAAKTQDSSALDILGLEPEFKSPAASAPDASLSCGGPFPGWNPGSCTQSCAPCRTNADCPPFFGMNQKCCSYCP